jgi:hypothetical protein
MLKFKNIFTFMGMLAIGSVYANTYVSPVIKSNFHLNSNIIGNYVVEVISVGNDRYETQTKRADGNTTVETRLFGILTLEKLLNESILSGDAAKASQIFPMAVGKNVSFVTHGARSNGSSWSRNHKWEVMKSYEKLIGSDLQQLWTIKVFAESPGFFKFEGTCEYSIKYSTCLKIEGERFIRGNDRSTGAVKNSLEKIVLDGVEMVISK